MPGYSLVPVDYQPDFEGYSLAPVDYDPFPEDGTIQQAGTQLASQPQPDAGFDQPPSAPQTPGSAPPALANCAERRTGTLRSATAGTRSALAISGLAADAWRPQRDARDRASGSTPNPDRAGAGGAATAWPDVRARTDGWRQRRDSTGADTDSTSAATAAKPAATACDGSRSARRQRAGDRQQPQRIGWRRYRPHWRWPQPGFGSSWS
jgi:hypothetical protein